MPPLQLIETKYFDMNISEHTGKFIQEMKRRNYSQNTIDNYTSCIKVFFGQSKKDHPKNVNGNDIRNYLSQFTESNTKRSHHGAIKLFYKICLNQPNKFKYLPYCKKNKKLPIVLSQDEIQKMFGCCVNIKHIFLKMSCKLMNKTLFLVNENLRNLYNKITY